MSGGGSTKTQQDTSPWGGVQPYLKDLFTRAQQQSQQGEQYYPGQTYADIAPRSQQYYDIMAQNALNPSAAETSSGNYYSDVLSGKYLNQQNPAMQKMIGDVTNQIGASVGGRFTNSGGYMGSPGEVQDVAGEVSKAVVPYAFQTYNQERGLQGDAAKQQLILDQIRKGDLSGLMAGGQAQQGQQQAAMNEAMQRWNYNQQSPWDILSKYSQMIQPGTQFSTTQGKQSAPATDWGSVAGGGIGALGSMALLAMLL